MLSMGFINPHRAEVVADVENRKQVVAEAQTEECGVMNAEGGPRDSGRDSGTQYSIELLRVIVQQSPSADEPGVPLRR